MKTNYVEDLDKLVGKEVKVSGWVDAIRDLKHVQFMILRDSTGKVQVTNEKKGEELEKIISDLTQESTVNVKGELIRNEKVNLGQMEIKPYEINVTSHAGTPLPIEKDSSLSKRQDWRYLDLRNPEKKLIFEIQTVAEHAMRNYWIDNNFIEIHSPKLMKGASESGAELFQLEYFGGIASLAQSPQFYKQMAMASGFNNVFEIGPVFRANPSFTSRHDTEFTSVDVEMSWIDSHEDVMEFEENWLQYVIEVVEDKYGDNIKDTFDVELNVPETPFPRVSMKDAYKILDDIGHKIPENKNGDLDPQGERLLSQYVKENMNHELVFITNYPEKVRPFYHMRFEDDPDLTKSFDLLWKGLEVTTGAQREHRYDVLYEQIEEKGMNPSSLENYLDFFKHGCPPHGGYGFGLTRMLMKMVEAKNVREVTYLHRAPNRLNP